MAPVPVISASPPPLLLTAALIRSLYFFESLNLRKSTEIMLGSVSAKDPSSSTRAIRSRALIRKAYRHLGQTRPARSTSALYTISLQESHLIHRPSAMTTFLPCGDA